MLPIGGVGHLVEGILEQFISKNTTELIGHLIFLVEFFLAIAFLKAVLSYGVIHFLNGDRITFKELRLFVTRKSLGFTFKIFGISIICFLLTFLGIIFGLSIYITFMLEALPIFWGVAALIALGVILPIFVASRTYVVIPIAVIEHTDLICSFRRSHDLVKGFGWGVIRILFLVGTPVIAIHYSIYSVGEMWSGGIVKELVIPLCQMSLIGVVALFDATICAICYTYFKESTPSKHKAL